MAVALRIWSSESMIGFMMQGVELVETSCMGGRLAPKFGSDFAYYVCRASSQNQGVSESLSASFKFKPSALSPIHPLL